MSNGQQQRARVVPVEYAVSMFRAFLLGITSQRRSVGAMTKEQADEYLEANSRLFREAVLGGSVEIDTSS